MTLIYTTLGEKKKKKKYEVDATDVYVNVDFKYSCEVMKEMTRFFQRSGAPHSLNSHIKIMVRDQGLDPTLLKPQVLLQSSLLSVFQTTNIRN